MIHSQSEFDDLFFTLSPSTPSRQILGWTLGQIRWRRMRLHPNWEVVAQGRVVDRVDCMAIRLVAGQA